MPPRRFTDIRHAVIPWKVSESSAMTAKRISVAVMPISIRPGGSLVVVVPVVLVVLVVAAVTPVVVVGRGRVVGGGGCVVVACGGSTRVVPGATVLGVNVGGVVLGASVELVVGASVTVVDVDVELVVVPICTCSPSPPDVARIVAPTPMRSAKAATPTVIQYCWRVTGSV
jgi:hypothetical protein